MFDLKFNKLFLKKAKKLTQKDKKLDEKLDSTLDLMSATPFDLSLKTHKVNSKKFGERYSSRLTGDLRIIWDFDKSTQMLKIIMIQDIGGHSGNKGVY